MILALALEDEDVHAHARQFDAFAGEDNAVLIVKMDVIVVSFVMGYPGRSVMSAGSRHPDPTQRMPPFASSLSRRLNCAAWCWMCRML